MWYEPENVSKLCNDMRELTFEQIRLVFPNNKTTTIANGYKSHVDFDEYNALTIIMETGFKEFVLVHNHTPQYYEPYNGKKYGRSEPSKQDKQETKKLVMLCKLNGLVLKDHIIVSIKSDEKDIKFWRGKYILTFPLENLFSFKKNKLIGG